MSALSDDLKRHITNVYGIPQHFKDAFIAWVDSVEGHQPKSKKDDPVDPDAPTDESATDESVTTEDQPTDDDAMASIPPAELKPEDKPADATPAA